jgi:Flp pilus assembly protein TadG
MVLLETALAIPLLLAIAVALSWGISLTATTMTLGDAARSAARDLARGTTVSEALSHAHASAPGAHLRIENSDDSVAVVADQDVSAPGPILRGISVTLTQRVVVPREWQ